MHTKNNIENNGKARDEDPSLLLLGDHQVGMLQQWGKIRVLRGRHWYAAVYYYSKIRNY